MKDSTIEKFDNKYIKKLYVIAETICRIIPDKAYLRMIYRIRLGKKLDLKNPKTLSEKLQWLKIYNRKQEYSRLVDKYEVKSYVENKIGNKYITPTLGIWNTFDEINFNSLPDQFVLKCTHDSGSIVVCRDKEKFDYQAAKLKLNKGLRRNYYWGNREWPYKNVARKIIAEPYIDSLGKPESVEYKVTCFNGKVEFVTLCKGIAHSALSVRTNDFFDTNFNYMPFYAFYKNSDNGRMFNKPIFWDELIAISEKLAGDIPYIRVDFYAIDNQLLFGEMTFFTWGGFLNFNPPETDLILGEKLQLPQK